MKKPYIIGIENPESQQGKSTITWILANALAMQNHSVIVLDLDEINPNQDTPDPTVSSYVSARIPLSFRVIKKADWPKDDSQMLSSCDYLLYDGSKTPPKWLTDLIAQTAHGCIVPIRNGRGWTKGITYAQQMFRARIPLFFILNGVTGSQLSLIPGVCVALDAQSRYLRELDGIHDMTAAGRLPQMSDDTAHITESAEVLAADIAKWIRTTTAASKDEHIRQVA